MHQIASSTRNILPSGNRSNRPTHGRPLAFTIATLLATALPAFSANWDGGTGIWSTTAPQWDGGSTWVQGSAAVFGGTIGTVSLGEAITAASIALNTSGYVIDLAGSDLTVTGTTTALSSTPITNTSATTATFKTVGVSNPTRVTGNLNLTVGASWTPTNVNDFTGTFHFQPVGGATATLLTISSSTLGSATGLIKLDASLLTGSAAARINWSSPDNTQFHNFTRDIELIHGETTFAEFLVNGAKEVTLSGTVSGGTAGGAGIRFVSGQGTIVLAGNNTYSGSTAITGQNGLIILEHANALGNSSGFSIGSGLLGSLGFRGGIDVGAATPVTLSGSATTSGFGMMHSFSGNNSFAGGITHNSNTVRTYGAEADSMLTLTGVLSGGKGLAKIGRGTVVLTGQNTFPTANAGVGNEVAVNDGTLRLDFSLASWETSPGVQENIVNHGKNTNSNANEVAQLVLGGGTLEVKGKPDFVNTQRFKSGSNTTATNTFTINPGASAVRAIQNGATSLTIDLGKLLQAQRKPGGTVDFTLPTAGAIVLPAVTGSVGLSNTILTANGAVFATVDRTDWASLDGTRNIVGGSTVAGFYTPNTGSLITGNADMSGGVDTLLAADATVTSLRFHESGTRVLDLGNRTLTTGGVLVTAHGNVSSSIDNGILRAAPGAANQDLVIVQDNQAGPLVIGATIIDTTTVTEPPADAPTTLTKSGRGTLILTSPATAYTGETFLNEGMIRLEDDGVLGPNKLVFHGGVLGLKGGTTFDRVLSTAAGTNTVQFVGSGGFAAYGGDVTIDIQSLAAQTIVLNMGGTNGFVPTGAAFILGSADSDGTVVVNNPVFLRAPNQPQQREIQVNDGLADVDARLASGIVGANQDGGLTKSGAGTLEVAGAAGTYTGPTIIEGGVLRVGIANAIPNTPLTVRAGVYDLNEFDQTLNRIMLNMGGGAPGTVSAITTGNGTLTLGTNLTYNGNAANDGGAFIVGNLSLGTATRTFIVHDSAAIENDLTISASISGTGGLRKTGAGTLHLAGANTYAGATNIVEGTLNVSGTISPASAINASGGTLAGIGTVGAVTLSGGGILAPGSGPGILNSGNVALNGGTLELEIESTTSFDQLNVSGFVVFGGPVQLSLSLSGNFADGTEFTIISNDGAEAISMADGGSRLVFGGDPLEEGDIFTAMGAFGAQAFQISYAGGADFNDVVLTTVPEPGSAAMLLAGIACVVGSGRRRAQAR